VCRDPFSDKRGVKGVIYFEYLKVLEIFPNRVHGQHFLPEAFISDPVGTAGYLLSVKLFGVNLAGPASVAVACRSDGDLRVNAAKKIPLGTLKDFVIQHLRHQSSGLVSIRKASHENSTPHESLQACPGPDPGFPSGKWDPFRTESSLKSALTFEILPCAHTPTPIRFTGQREFVDDKCMPKKTLTATLKKKVEEWFRLAVLGGKPMR